MKQVQLDYDKPVTISDNAFKRIEEIVKHNMVCGTCEKPYTVEYLKCLAGFSACLSSSPVYPII